MKKILSYPVEHASLGAGELPAAYYTTLYTMYMSLFLLRFTAEKRRSECGAKLPKKGVKIWIKSRFCDLQAEKEEKRLQKKRKCSIIRNKEAYASY